MKVCTSCKEAKPLREFGKQQHAKDGLRHVCKPCNNAKARAWGKANPEKAKAGARRWALENPERREVIRLRNYEKYRDIYIANMRERARAKPEEYRETARRWRENNPERALGNVRKWRLENPEKVTLIFRRFYQNNKEKVAAWGKNWRANNPGKVRALWTARELRKRGATPKWLTREQVAQIEAFYAEAADLTAKTGVMHHVDHIHPIRGKNFCGLHVPWNLQVLTAEENLKKGARLVLVEGVAA